MSDRDADAEQRLVVTEYCYTCAKVTECYRSFTMGGILWACKICGKTVDWDFDDADEEDRTDAQPPQ